MHKDITIETSAGVEYKIHKTKLTNFVNPVLRRIQFWTNKPYVISSNFSEDYNVFLGYGFNRMETIKKVDDNK